jgi:hypothetical protein
VTVGKLGIICETVRKRELGSKTYSMTPQLTARAAPRNLVLLSDASFGDSTTPAPRVVARPEPTTSRKPVAFRPSPMRQPQKCSKSASECSPWLKQWLVKPLNQCAHHVTVTLPRGSLQLDEHSGYWERPQATMADDSKKDDRQQGKKKK